MGFCRSGLRLLVAAILLQGIAACENSTITSIHAIQGSGEKSPLEDSVVTIEGVVVADFQEQQELKGFFVQEEPNDQDNNPQTSEGIFVFGGEDVEVGDAVRLTGRVKEFHGLTELVDPSDLMILGKEPVVATSVSLPLDNPEAYEGMLLQFPQRLVVTDSFNLHRFGEVILAPSRQEQPSNVRPPGPANSDEDGNGIADVNEATRLLLDDGSTEQFPKVVPYLEQNNTLRLGDSVENLTGVLSYGFDAYRLQATEVRFTRLNSRRSLPPVESGLRLMSFNVLNYFTTIADGRNDARGADSREEFERQQAKIVAALKEADADLVGLIELENKPGVLANLVSALNETVSEPYAFIDAGTVGEDAIKVGIIYKPDALRPVGQPLSLNTDAFRLSRQPLAQRFEDRASNEQFTFVINHFKSKSCRDADGGNLDQKDGQGCYNQARVLATQDLIAWLDTQLMAEVVIMGDLNAYLEEDPIKLLEDAGYVNVVREFIAKEKQYSFVFFGQAGLLDHAFVSPELLENLKNIDIWHINADEPRALSYNDSRIDAGERESEFEQDFLYQADPYRSSDHDPIIVELSFDE